MNERYSIAKNTIKEFVNSRESFSYQSLKSEIKRRGGAMKVAVGVTIKDYLNVFVEDGILRYVPVGGVFCKVRG